MKRLDFLKPNWERVVEDFKREDEELLKEARKEAGKNATSKASELLWARATAPNGETQTAPTSEACQAAMDAMVEQDARLTAPDLNIAWHSKRFPFRPQSGILSEPEKIAQTERDAYTDLITLYGDADAKEALPNVIAWKEMVYEKTGKFDALFTLKPDMLTNPQEALTTIERMHRDSNKHTLERQWLTDIMVRALQGRLSYDEAWEFFQELKKNYETLKKMSHTELRPPCIDGIRAEEEFIKRFARKEK